MINHDYLVIYIDRRTTPRQLTTPTPTSGPSGKFSNLPFNCCCVIACLRFQINTCMHNFKYEMHDHLNCIKCMTTFQSIDAYMFANTKGDIHELL